MASVRKRRWIYKGEAKETWVVNYTDHGGSRRQRTFRLKKDANAYRLKVENELDSGTHTPRRLSVTVEAAVQAMLGDARGKVSPDYHEQLELVARRYLIPELGNTLLVDLTPPVVQAYADQLLSRGVSINPITRSLHALRRTLKLAMRMRPAWVSHNVMKESPPQLPAQRKKQISIPTRNEVRQILDASAAVGWRGVARPLIYLAVLTGMRASELRGLEWGDVDFAKGLIRVRRSRDSNGGLRPTKSEAGVRDIPFGPVLAQVLKEWKLRARRNEFDVVFANRWGNPVSGDYHQMCAWLPTLAKVGLAEQARLSNGHPYYRRARYHFHALRHVAATLMIAGGATPKVVQTIMGHSSIQMTYNVYGHLFEDDQAPAQAVASIVQGLGLE